MKYRLFHLSAILMLALTMASCSHLETGGGPPPPSQNATLSFTLTDTPPANTSAVSVLVPVTAVTVTPATGTATTVTSNPVLNVELTRLSSDSLFLGAVSVPSGVYNSVALTLGAPTITFVNQTSGTVNGCLAGEVCKITLTAPTPLTFSTSGVFPLTLNSGDQKGFSLDVDLNTALTSTGGSIGLDFTLANVLTAVALPRPGTGLPSGALDLIEDFTGVVTQVNATTQTVTIKSETRGTLTAKANSSTRYDNFQKFNNNQTCTNVNSPDFSCISSNQALSLELAVNPDGTLTILEADNVDNPAIDEIEGTIVAIDSSSTNTFTIALAEKTVTATNSVLPTNPAPAVGDLVQVSFTSATFDVDTKDFSSTQLTNAVALFRQGVDTSTLLLGQTVMVDVRTAVAPSGNIPLTITTDFIWLRWSRVTANVSVPPGGGTQFDIDSNTLPPYMAVAGNATVQIFSTPVATSVDGLPDINSLASGNNVSLRALLIKNSAAPFYNFFAAKVRKH